MSERLAIFAEGLFTLHSGKTAHGVIRYGTREVVCVIDSTQAGRTAVEVEPFCLHPVPVVASVREAIDMGATTLLIGVAPTGGKLDPDWRPALLEAIAAGLDLEAGLHTELSADEELRAAAERAGTKLRDLRAAPADLTVPKGPYSRPDSVRVVHSVGSDTVIGKKVVTLELDRAARERGRRSVYVPTGQTGVAIAGWGIAVDHVISDYVAGAGERLVDEGAERGDLLFVEGQGALFHPAYSGVTLGLLHGSAPDQLILVHKAGARSVRNYPELAARAAGRADRRLRARDRPRPAGQGHRDRAQHERARRGRRPRRHRVGPGGDRADGRRRRPVRPRTGAGRGARRALAGLEPGEQLAPAGLPSAVSSTASPRRSSGFGSRRTRPRDSSLSSRFVMVPVVTSVEPASSVGESRYGAPARRSVNSHSSCHWGDERVHSLRPSELDQEGRPRHGPRASPHTA